MAWTAAVGMFTQAIGSAYGASIQADALKAQRDHQAWLSNYNQELAEMKGREAVRMGEGKVTRFRGEVSKLMSKQRTSMAAQNLDMTFGAAADIQTDTLTMAEADITQIRNNAWQQAWGFKMEALSTRLQGTLDYNATSTKITNTLLTGMNNTLNYGMQGAAEANRKPTQTSNNGYIYGDDSQGRWRPADSAGGSYRNTSSIS